VAQRIVSVAAESFDFRNHLAPSVEAALPEVIDYIRKIVCGAGSSQAAHSRNGN
jgi:hypothetical protein